MVIFSQMNHMSTPGDSDTITAPGSFIRGGDEVGEAPSVDDRLEDVDVQQIRYHMLYQIYY